MNAVLATNDVGLHPVGYVSIGYTQVGIGSGTSATLLGIPHFFRGIS